MHKHFTTWAFTKQKSIQCSKKDYSFRNTKYPKGTKPLFGILLCAQGEIILTGIEKKKFS